MGKSRDHISEQSFSVSILGGRLSMQEEFGLPFQLDVIGALEDLGVVNESTGAVRSAYPDVPPFPPSTPPVATLGLETLLIGFGLYLATKLSDKAVDEILSAVYADRVQPALRRLASRLRSHRVQAGEPILTRFDHWFDGSKVLVRVCVYTAAPETADSQTVSEALRLAVNWLTSHEVTHRVLTYEELSPVEWWGLGVPGGSW
ncbi:hypothetical protein [Leekyejoonella antrihumi]|uniref:Uncharacterized protein n=1 Tax=Leekyejoonella antrihumi TaxID=1660198 RepID=A0A563DRK5_9MICO|nr:hypothetical protein [Leekyejoonella antrihumi]TWP32593.1 hypothetical protein FGL98_23875 [Leekyejoonella antrihumi]